MKGKTDLLLRRRLLGGLLACLLLVVARPLGLLLWQDEVRVG